MLHTKFVEIGPQVTEKKIFEGFFTVYVHGCHFGIKGDQHHNNKFSFPCI